MKGWEARSEKGFLESKPGGAGAWLRRTSDLRAGPGSRSLWVVEVCGRVTSTYLSGESRRGEVGVTCQVLSGPCVGKEQALHLVFWAVLPGVSS